MAAGPARRFQVGDPAIQVIDVLAGAIMNRVAEAGEQTRRGEVVLGAEVVVQLGNAVQILEWRGASETGADFAVVSGLSTIESGLRDGQLGLV